MQEQMELGPVGVTSWDILPGQSLATLLALVGAKRMGVEALRQRTKLSAYAFVKLLSWLQQGYMVDVITSLDGDRVLETVALTDRGESALVSLLERTCELPELR